MRTLCRRAVSGLFQKAIQRVTTLALLCVSLYAHAIVSMENIHLGKPAQGFVGQFALDLAYESGNTEQAGVESGVKFQWTRDKVTDFILANYAYAENAGIRNKNKAFTHYRHIHRLDDEYAWEAFTQFSADEFTNLALRALAGGDVRITLGEVSDTSAFFLGLGAFYEHEELDSIYPDEADTQDVWRASTYLVCKYQFNAYVSLVSATYYQPRLGDAGDFRAIENLSVESRLTEASSLKVGIDIAYDSEPPRDVKETDSSIKVGIVVKF
jgi:putative salt-induced outer membrane protein YdiY